MADDIIIPTPPPVASYPYTDIQDQSGTVQYYLYANKYYEVPPVDNTVTEYNIDTDTPFSSVISIESADGDGMSKEWNFDTGEFNTPRVINGTVTMQYMIIGKLISQAFTYRTQIKLYHYDGSTETQMGNTWNSPIQTPGNPPDADDAYAHLAKISVPSTKFKRGEQLRVELTVIKIDSDGGMVEIGIDPQNRDSPNITPSTDANHFTTFKMNIPFRIDL
tara:strand:+ start:538 stop:1197 length:660 start_codon:yes stop_codon:yes gene_type:complete